MSSEVGTSATGIAFRKADPSTPVHRTSGRDDKMRVFFWRECKKKKNIGRRLQDFSFFLVFLFFEIAQALKIPEIRNVIDREKKIFGTGLHQEYE